MVDVLLAKELGVEVVDEDLLYPRFGEAVLSVERDELAAYALELRQGHWRRRQFNWLFDVWNRYLTPSLASVVFLVHHDLCEDIGRRLIELVEVVLLCRRFLARVRWWLAGDGGGTYQHCRQVRLHSLHLAITAYHGFPYLIAWRCFVLLYHDEQRTIPSCHAIGLFVSEDQVLKVLFVISAVAFLVGEQLLVVFTTSLGWCTYVQL